MIVKGEINCIHIVKCSSLKIESNCFPARNVQKCQCPKNLHTPCPKFHF